MTRVLVDTNILVYAALGEQEMKHDAAVDAISGLVHSKRMVVSVQNLAELSRVLLEKTKPPVKTSDAKRIVFGYSNCSDVLRYSEHTVVNALSLRSEYGIHLFDALIASTMQESGVSRIFTENVSDFRQVPWIKATNPLTSPD
jgi:predicted nucleic acid-binding protein